MKTKIIALSLAALAAPVTLLPAPAAAQAASEADAQEAGQFIGSLADRAFNLIRSGDADSAATKNKLRSMLADNFDVDYIGQYLIRRHKDDINAQQYREYMQVFPSWVVETYTNNLFAFQDADLEVIRAVPRGTRGDIEVYTRVEPASGAPINAVWQLRKVGDEYLIRNMKVSGVNMALTQEQDFNSYISRNGFDALVALMKKRVA